MEYIPLLILVGAVYALIFLPQQRRTKAHRQLLGSLEPGDMVVTNGGIHGAVAEVEDAFIWLEVAPEVELKVAKAAIAERIPDDRLDDDDDDDDVDEDEDLEAMADADTDVDEGDA